MTRIELVIDEVVWHGGKPSDRLQFGSALERALARELRDPGVQHSLGRAGRRLSSVDAGRVPRVGGDTVARAIVRGLASTTRSKP